MFGGKAKKERYDLVNPFCMIRREIKAKKLEENEKELEKLKIEKIIQS